MPKMFVFELGWNHYAVPIEDGPLALQLLQSMRKVEAGGYQKPYTFAGDDLAFTSLTVAEVVAPEPPAPPPEPPPPEPPLRLEHTAKLPPPRDDLPF